MNRQKCADSMLYILPHIFKKFKKVYHVSTMPRQQFELLFYILKQDCQTASYYSEKMMIPKSNITVASTKLVEDGLIERTFSDTDRRKIIFKVTDKGRDFLNVHMKQVKEAMMIKLEEYSDADIIRINALLEELKDILDAGDSDSKDNCFFHNFKKEGM